MTEEEEEDLNMWIGILASLHLGAGAMSSIEDRCIQEIMKYDEKLKKGNRFTGKTQENGQIHDRMG